MTRAQNEIWHGRKLSEGGPEAIWGWGTPAGQKRAARRAALIMQAADLKSGMRVLEIGCGSGLFTEIFARSGSEIIALDISDELLDYARQRGLPANVTLVCSPFEALDSAEPFDAVIGSSVLHHLDIQPALAEIFRLLKPGGVMSFAEPNMLNPQIAVQKNIPWIKEKLGDSPDETAFVRWTLARQMRRVGFTEICISPLDWLHPATPKNLIPAVEQISNLLEKLPLVREISGSVYISARKPD
jgi:ubiquinone/menaquinone biosynthesis C-methylase UbiE